MPLLVKPETLRRTADPAAETDPVPRRGEGPSFLVGRSAQGAWLAVEIHGLGAGIFRTRSDAVAYAAAETGCRREAVPVSEAPLVLRLR
ncbi:MULTISPECIES: hypothetical protein [Methylobacterium]|uniref:RAG2 PHD domain containing protein n=1 Tax=Methylobacterium jeotgali TaxID=381630 RepID=A0ABQ4STC7_9HYPH|nr:MULTISPECIES: hypothetical protein [Methylobacterium]GBU18348.1 hypothetical protein AwMethylo_25630 [Methylobacterium sp.]GJE04926.1 hypothetical protein AOPFMNJM_0218 [Methylobacterium jeotgali]